MRLVEGRVQPRSSQRARARLLRRSAAAAARCFEQWEGLIATRLRADGWPEDSVVETASAALALVEGALLLARVSGQVSHLTYAKRSLQIMFDAHHLPGEGRAIHTAGSALHSPRA